MFEVLGTLREMRPAVAMDRNNHRVGKRVRCLDRIIGVHGEVERTSCAGRAGKEEDHAGTKAARHLGYAIVPDRIASDVERRYTVRKARHEANYVAR